MNNVQLIGNLARDPEYRLTNGGEKQTAICRFTVAVEDGYGDNKRVSFLPVVVFGKQAESCNQYLKKGNKVGVTGRLQTGSYEKDGVKHYTTDIIAGRVEFLSPKNSGSSGAGAAPQQQTPPPQQESMDGFETLNDDDIPF